MQSGHPSHIPASPPIPQTLPEAAATARDFLHALCEALIRACPEGAGPAGRQAAARAAAFLDAQQKGLPHVMAPAMRLASVCMDLSTLPRRRRRFRDLDLDTRLEVVAAWRRSRLGPVVTFLKFHEVFASYILHSQSGEGRVA